MIDPSPDILKPFTTHLGGGFRAIGGSGQCILISYTISIIAILMVMTFIPSRIGIVIMATMFLITVSTFFTRALGRSL